jgi:putative tricarboxylic transport membrane protein
MSITRRKLLKSMAPLAMAPAFVSSVAKHAFAAWIPTETVELVVPTGPGSTIDLLARAILQTWQDDKLLPVKATINTREGGGHVVHYNYMASKKGKPSVIGIASSNLVINNLAGRMSFSHADFSPVAMLVNGAFYTVGVPAESPIKSAEQLVATMKSNPASLSVAIGSALGASQHLAFGVLMQTAGVPDLRQARVVNFSDSSGVVPAVLGKHVDVGLISASNAIPHMESGAIRILATTAATRSGAFTTVPTWEELGYKGGVIGSWRGLVGSPGMTPDQVAFWADVARKTVENKQFKAFVENSQLEIDHRDPAAFKAFLDAEFVQLKNVLAYLGVKPQ